MMNYACLTKLLGIFSKVQLRTESMGSSKLLVCSNEFQERYSHGDGCYLTDWFSCRGCKSHNRNTGEVLFKTSQFPVIWPKVMSPLAGNKEKSSSFQMQTPQNRTVSLSDAKWVLTLWSSLLTYAIKMKLLTPNWFQSVLTCSTSMLYNKVTRKRFCRCIWTSKKLFSGRGQKFNFDVEVLVTDNQRTFM